jgi:hypothetical protein
VTGCGEALAKLARDLGERRRLQQRFERPPLGWG